MLAPSKYSTVPAPDPSLSRHRILVVEDETLVAWSIASILTRAGYQTTVEVSGEAAIQTFSERSFDLVITDYRLPQINGLDVAAAVKRYNKSTPVILISAMTENGPNVVNWEGQAEFFMEKPFDLDEIIRVVGQLLQPGKASPQS
jgi:two-component system, NtrC family, response regulator AtoC